MKYSLMPIRRLSPTEVRVVRELRAGAAECSDRYDGPSYAVLGQHLAMAARTVRLHLQHVKEKISPWGNTLPAKKFVLLGSRSEQGRVYLDAWPPPRIPAEQAAERDAA